MKRKNKTPKKFPWEIFNKHIQFGTPKINGLYMVYYKHNPPLAHDHMPMAGMEVISFADGEWYGNKQILGWIGPLPVLSLDELANKEECISTCFFIGSLKEIANNKPKAGPYFSYIVALCRAMAVCVKNDFIFGFHSHKTLPTPISKLNTKTQKFDKLKEKDVKKYNKILKKYLKKEK